MELSELFRQIDIVEYISQYVELTENNGEYWGISPFTFPPEKTPSFSVRRETGEFYDFSSGTGGNVYTFTKRYFHCSSAEAVQKLCDFAGMDDSEIQPAVKLSATEVCKRFARKPKEKVRGVNKVLPETCMEKYERDPEKLSVWISEGISEASIDRFQVSYDRFSNRLVYPIRNHDGKIVNIGGRTLDPDWKEKKLRKYCYFYGWDGGVDLIYGEYENRKAIRDAREIILFEGCKSVMLADTYGIKNAGALLTSHLNPMQMKLLASLGCRVVFALDKDVNIFDDHNIQKLNMFVDIWYLKDVDDLLQPKDSPVDRGEAVFRILYENKRRLR